MELETLDDELGIGNVASSVEVVDEQQVLEFSPEVGGEKLLARDGLGRDGRDGHGLLGLELVVSLVGDDAGRLELGVHAIHDEVGALLGVGGIAQDRLLDDVAHEALVARLALKNSRAVDFLERFADAAREKGDQLVL